MADKTGALYGVTFSGGDPACNLGCGTIFKLRPKAASYAESVIYRFKAGSDGSNPDGTLLMDRPGALFGTTFAGGENGAGTVFELSPKKGTYRERVLFSFSLSSGYWPEAGLVADASGALYGTTTSGGTARCKRYVYCGTAYRLTPTSSGYATTIIYDFHGLDGANSKAPLFVAPSGTLYGTTSTGGTDGPGTIFMLKPKDGGYAEWVLYSFSGLDDGGNPQDGLLSGTEGELFGTTPLGGACSLQGGCGVVFQVAP